METPPPLVQRLSRRRLIHAAGASTVVSLLGATWIFSEELTELAKAESRSDGRPRLPPGQKVLKRLKPMGGAAGKPGRGTFRLRVHGEVERPFTLNFKQLLKLGPAKLALDVHCVTGWSVLGAPFEGVRLKTLAKRARLKKSARYVIFEAAHGYKANLPLREALKPNVLIAHRLFGKPLRRAHGAPARAVVPDLYFWKSAKWITGIRFSKVDIPGYWEKRGYHRRGNPWQEERHA